MLSNVEIRNLSQKILTEKICRKLQKILKILKDYLNRGCYKCLDKAECPLPKSKLKNDILQLNLLKRAEKSCQMRRNRM